MSEQETHNFMKVSVDSFSELPFIRPVPAAQDNSSNTNPAIRLFGIDFPADPDADADADDPFNDPPSSTTETSNTPPLGGGGAANADSGESVRKFECHYCCRKFPTSQALGGHQNAHKRERQHAKRAHLHSAMASQQYHHPSFFPGSNHVYGYLNYGRHLGSVPSSARFDHPQPTHYPSWAGGGSPSMNPSAARFYGGIGSASQLINGSPFPGLWRMPVHGGTVLPGAQGDHPPALPLFGGRDAAVEGGAGVGSSSSSSSSLASPKDHGVFDSRSRTNSLSLDLHL
ncbi:zinc finger protein 8-like [Canna indica]|uniref:Zinc finger protein 8-like n=1 Tax=Canna indica TaxID=4628 RepID=A0AAQ3KDE2_9LILI|nr:zinc finger protein 8-like [Canna indica]